MSDDLIRYSMPHVEGARNVFPRWHSGQVSDFDLQTDAQTMDRRDGVVVIRLMVPGVVSAPGRYRIKLAEPLPVHVDTEVVKAEVWWPDMRDLVVATDRPQAVSADDQFEVIVHFEDLGSFVPEPFNGR